jgi:hypothetical protein
MGRKMNAEIAKIHLTKTFRLILPWMLLAAAAMVTDARADDEMGGLKVTTKPAGAKVYVDGRLRGKTPLLLEVTTGMHTVEVRNPGYKTVKKKVKVTSDKIVRLNFSLTKQKTRKSPKTTTNQIRVHDTKAGGPDSGPGTVTVVTSPPGLTVFLDEYYIPQPTPVAFDVKAGVYELRVEQDGDTVYRKTVFVQAGRTLDLDLVIKKTRKIDYSDPWK